jgi:hypothetical protein
MSSTSSPTTSTAATPAGTRSPVLWRIAGGLALAHIVLMFAGFSQEVLTEHSTSQADFVRILGGADLTRTYVGGYIEALAFLVLVPAVVLVARLLSRRTDVGRIAATTFLALGSAYVASTLAVGFPPGAAAMYGLQHGADARSAAMIMDVRNFGFVLQVAMSCAMALALGIAALAERIHVRWVGWGGLALGTVGLVATPFAHNVVSMAWVIWWVGLGVLFLRGSRQPRETAVPSPADASS